MSKLQKTKDRSNRAAKVFTLEIRPKKRPRGRPFAKGNKHGPRFPKGVSPNPGGRPKSATAAEACRAFLSAPATKAPFGKDKTNAENIVEALGTKALLGDRGCAEAIFNRAEGTPRQTLDVADNRADPLAGLVTSVEKLYQQGMRIAEPQKAKEENSENAD
jgi:Family of unknown function (DUF5681)